MIADKILFLDIETVPRWPDYDAMPEHFRVLWNHKANHIKNLPDDTARSLYPRAGIYAEFGKIICISTGFFHQDCFRIKSFYGDDEKIMLEDFKGRRIWNAWHVSVLSSSFEMINLCISVFNS